MVWLLVIGLKRRSGWENLGFEMYFVVTVVWWVGKTPKWIGGDLELCLGGSVTGVLIDIVTVFGDSINWLGSGVRR